MNIDIEFTKEEKEMLKQYAELYDKERDLDITSDPIVVVQVQEEIPTSCEYADGHAYKNNTTGEIYYSEEELSDSMHGIVYNIKTKIIDMLIENDNYISEDYNLDLSVVYYMKKYKDVAYFLTRKEAEKYIKYQKHNLNNPRVYTKNAGYSNYGDFVVLSKLLKKMGEELLQGKDQ